MSSVDWLDRVLKARVRLIDLVLPRGNQIDGSTAVEIRNAIEALEVASYRAGVRYVSIDEPAAPVSDEELAAVHHCIKERSDELEAERKARAR